MNAHAVAYRTKAFDARALAFIVLMALLSAACASPAASANHLPAPVSASREAAPATLPVAVLGDPQELETFVDGVINKQLAELNIAGAVVAIVKDGQALLAKGYGYADVAKRIPADAEQTLFRPGSVTKLFTWTAVMQMVEQGKIDLQADVNIYLTDVQIPATYAQPVTMLNLMAHTSGFGETVSGASTYDPEDLTPLGVYVARYMPARAYPPGQVPAYSNYNATLAGYIIEQVSGEPYEQYVEDHILAPLGMADSTMHQPLPAQFVAKHSRSYRFNGEFQDIPFLLIQISPAGALSASGADMATFMLAHLQDGEYNGVRILKPETARLMHSQSYTFDPAVNGNAHGFMEWTINGRRLIGHSGDVDGYAADMRLIPEERVGFYICYNTSIHEAERNALLQAFMDRYFSPPPTPRVAAAPSDGQTAGRLARLTGFYISSRFNTLDSPEKVFALTDMMLVRSGPGNTLLFPGVLLQPLNPYVTDTWVEVRPRLLQNARTGDQMVFKEDQQGQVRYLAVAGNSSFNSSSLIFIKQPWHGRQDLHLGILVFSLLTFLLTLIVAAPAFFMSLVRRGAGGRLPRQGRPARAAALALCLAFLAFVVIFIQNLDNPGQPLIRILAWVIAALAVGVTPPAVVAWRQGWWNRASRLHYTVVALAGLAFTWFMAYWQLL